MRLLVKTKMVELLEFHKPQKVERLTSGAIVLRRVKYLGAKSTNVNPDGTRNAYPVSTRESSERHYEGAKIFSDHPSRKTPGSERSYRDQLGRLRGPFEHLPDGSYADLHINPKHPLAESVAWDAEHSPDSLGLSHNAQGSGRVRGEDCLVEDIYNVRSVDLICAPATTKGLYEGRQEDPVDLSTLTLEQFREARGDLVKLILSEGEHEDDDDKEKKDKEGGSDHQSDHQDNPDIDRLLGEAEQAGVTAEMVMEALRAMIDKAKGSDDDADADDDADIEEGQRKKASPALTKLQESNRQLRLEVDAMKAKDSERDQKKERESLLEASRLPKGALTKIFLEEVHSAETEKRASELIEDRRKIFFHQDPVSGFTASSGEVKNVGAFMEGKEG